jgi:Ring finger domain
MSDECPICFLENEEEFVTNCCHQPMHEECHAKCMRIKPECPLCRTPQPQAHIVITIVDDSSSPKTFFKNLFFSGVIGVSLALGLWAFIEQKRI